MSEQPVLKTAEDVLRYLLDEENAAWYSSAIELYLYGSGHHFTGEELRAIAEAILVGTQRTT